MFSSNLRYSQEITERVAESESDDDTDDDDSDDDLNIQVGQGYSTNQLSDITINTISEEDRSTHFIAIRVTVPDIISKAMEIQQKIVEKEEVSIIV